MRSECTRVAGCGDDTTGHVEEEERTPTTGQGKKTTNRGKHGARTGEGREREKVGICGEMRGISPPSRFRKR